MTVALSVLITYKDERSMLTKCVESFLRQTVPPVEVLVYDDASQHRPEEYLPDDQRVRVIHGHETVGPARGRNILMGEAAGKYIHFHDADDWALPGWGAAVTGAIESTGAQLVVTEASIYLDETLATPEILGLRRLDEQHDLVRLGLSGALLVPAVTVSREAALALGGYNERLWQSEDWEFNLRLATHCTYAVIPEPLVAIRRHAGNRSSEELEVTRGHIEAIRLLAESIPERYRDDLAQSAAIGASRFFRFGARRESAAAFSLARSIGRPSFAHRAGTYRTLARLTHPWLAEWVAEGQRGLTLRLAAIRGRAGSSDLDPR